MNEKEKRKKDIKIKQDEKKIEKKEWSEKKE